MNTRRGRSKSRSRSEHRSEEHKITYQFVDQLKSEPISERLDENKAKLEDMFQDCSDFVIRELRLEQSCSALAVFVDGLVDSSAVNDALKAIMISEPAPCDPKELQETVLPVNQTQTTDNYAEFLTSILGGDTGLIIDGSSEAVLLGMRGMEKRSISEPETESVVRGPREGFVENIRTNTSLLRRRVKSPHLKMKSLTLGKNTNTSIVLAYMDHIVEPELLQEVETRLGKVNISAVLESGYIEELIQDSSYSPFPQIQYTERPDTLASAILQGRVGIIVDGTPFALIVPTVFWQLMQASEDYYERFQIATLIRWLRYFFLVFSLLTPALYIAITTFHQDLLPTTLILSIAAAREAIPFPALVEALIMEITFEALREAGIRLPKAVGSAVSILGALVVGTAAVEAGIVSAPMVIVVSITGIASFTIPRFNGAIAIRMLRFPLMFAAALFGFFGIMLGVLLIAGHMSNLRSFGVSYLAPTSPLRVSDLKDVAIRAPWWAMTERPSFLHPQDKTRLGADMQKEIIEYGGLKGVNPSDKEQNSTGSEGKEEGSEDESKQ